MRFASIWLCAVSALALSACHRPQATAAHQPAKAPAAAPTAKLAANDKAGLPIEAPAPALAAPSSHSTRGHAQAAAAPTTHAKTANAQMAARQSTAKGLAATPVGQLAATAGAPPPAVRVDRHYSAEYESCLASANGFTVARASCHSAELARQGARVDRALNTVLAARSGEAKAQLVKDQRAWLEQRDSECQEDAGRVARDVLREGSCRLDMTVQRAIKLEHMES